MAEELEENLIFTLKNVGYESGNVKWMIDNEATKDFFKWFCENINSSNYLSEEELHEYNEIQASGLVLEGTDLDRELENIIPELDEFEDSDTKVLEYLKNELAKQKNYSLDMKSFLDEIRVDITSLRMQISQLENRNKILENKVMKIQEIYYKNITELDGSMRLLGDNMLEFVDYCNKFREGVQGSKLIAEYPVDVYKKERVAVHSDIQNYIQKLQLLVYQPKSSDSLVGDWESELNNMKERSEITRFLRLEHGAQRQALQYSIAWLRQCSKDNSFWASVSSPSSLWKMAHDVRERHLLIKQELGKPEEIGEQSILETTSASSGLWKKVKNGIQAYAFCQKQKLECLHREITILRKSQTLKAMSHIIETEKILCSKDVVLMMLLGDEMYRVLNTSHIVSSMANAMEKMKINALQRMELMKSSKERRDHEIQRIPSYPLLHFLSSQLTEYSKTRGPNLMLSSIWSDHSVNESINSILENLTSSLDNLKLESERIENTFLRNTNQHNLYIKSRCIDVLKLKKSLHNGSPSKKPVICSLKGLCLLHRSLFDRKDDELEIKIKKLKRISSSKKSEASKMQRKLWVIFYTNPSMLKELLQKEAYDNYGDI